MRAGSLACRASVVIDAQVALGCLHDGLSFVRIHHDGVVLRAIPDFDHADVVVRATRGAHRAADAGEIVDHDLTALLGSVDGSRGTPDHADRIDAMHAGVGDHVVAQDRAVPDESRIVLVT